MKHVKNMPTYTLALIFLVFGANYFLHFITMPPMTGDAGTFVGILFTTNFLLVVKILEIGIGALLLFSKTRALSLVLIAPISVSILLFEVCIVQQPGIGIFLVLLNGFAILQNQEKYNSIVRSIAN